MLHNFQVALVYLNGVGKVVPLVMQLAQAVERDGEVVAVAELFEQRAAALKRGDAVSIMGPSGSGKSTLLYILGALEPPTSGVVTLDGRNPFLLRERDLAA